MKIQTTWLKQFVQLEKPIAEIAAQLTQLGLEVEHIEGEVIEIAVPPNRADCLGMLGVARELAALNRLPLQIPPLRPSISPTDSAQPLSLTVKAAKACPRYLGRVIHGVNVKAATPQWMQRALAASGIQSISAIVDVTNYILLELGQPMHAFDYQTISGGLVVRLAQPHETLKLLDEQSITLQTTDLVIADQEKALALAGIMGGAGSGVQENTQDILLECAYFDPIQVRLSARQHKLISDSSYRFERGVDCQGQSYALQRAVDLLLDIAGGTPGTEITHQAVEYLPNNKTLTLRQKRLEKLLGMQPDREQVTQLLMGLGITVEWTDKAAWLCQIPSYRNDLDREIDLIEEVVRLIGFDQIPMRLPKTQWSVPTVNTQAAQLAKLQDFLVANGYQEAITYSFIDEASAKLCGQAATMTLLNPISSELSVMRPSLLPGLIKTVKYNQHRQATRMALFESGLQFVGESKDLQQSHAVAGVRAGYREPEQWHTKPQAVDFYDIKQDVVGLLSTVGIKDAVFKKAEHPLLHPGQAAAVYRQTRCMGFLGALHPAVAQHYDIEGSVMLFELETSALLSSSVLHYQEITKFPMVRRDLSFVVDQSVEVADVQTTVEEAVGETYLREVRLFDVYQGKGVEPGKKSLSLGISLQSITKTLQDDEVSKLMDKVIGCLQQQVGAELRV